MQEWRSSCLWKLEEFFPPVGSVGKGHRGRIKDKGGLVPVDKEVCNAGVDDIVIGDLALSRAVEGVKITIVRRLCSE